MSRRWVGCLIFMLGGSTIACGSSTEPTESRPVPTTIVVTPDSVNIPQGGSQQLTVAVLDQDSVLLSGVPVTFTTADSTRVTVSNVGLVSAVGRAGRVAVTATAGNASTDIPVVVTPVSSGIVVTPDGISIPQLGSAAIDATVVDAFGEPVLGAPLRFHSNSPGIVTVDTLTGMATSVGPAGTASVVITSGTLSRTTTVTVTQVATALDVSPVKIEMAPGMTRGITATVKDAVGQPMSTAITFESSDESVAAVSTTGVVTAPGPLGDVTVTVASGVLTKTVAVTVETPPPHPFGDIAKQVQLGGAYDVAVSRDNVVYVAQKNGGIARGDLPSFDLTNVITGSVGALSVAFNSTGTTAYVAGLDGPLTVVDVASNTVTASFGSGTVSGTPFAAAVAADDQTAVLGVDGATYTVDLATNTLSPKISSPSGVNHISVHPTQPLCYANLFFAGHVQEIDMGTQTVVRTFAVDGTPQGTVVSKDGSTLYVANEDGNLDVVDLSTGTVNKVPIGEWGGFGMAMSPDEAQLYITVPRLGLVRVVDVATLSVLRTITVGGTPRGVAFSPDGHTAIVANEAGWVHFIQ